MSHSLASMASRKRLEPLAFVRSPMLRTEGPGRKGRGCKARRSPVPISGSRRAGINPPRASTTAFRCAGVVPQHPPRTLTPSSVGEAPVVLGQLVRGEVVMHFSLHHRGQAGVRQARNRDPAMGAQVPEVLAHLGRASGAVEPDDVGSHGVQGRKGRADLATHQHPPGRLDGYLHLDRQLPGRHRPWPAGPPIIAALAWRRSWTVSMMRRSAPPAISPAAASW